MDTSESDLSFHQALAVLRRRTPAILLCFIVATGGAFGLSKIEAKKYTATAELLFTNSQLANEVAGLPTVSSGGATQQSLQDTNVELVQIGDMAAKTANQLGHGLTKHSVKTAVAVTPQGDTNVVNVSATSTSPTLAAQIANIYSTIFVDEQENADHQYYVSALAAINQQLAKLSPSARSSAQGIALQDRAQSLATLAEIPAGIVQIASAASTPTSPSSPKVARNTIVGAVLGFLLGLFLALLLERLDQRIREPKDLEAIYGVPLLGVVPESNAFARTPRRDALPQRPLPGREAEAFHLIRAHLRYFKVDRDLRSLLIGSAGSGDGKTTVARYLAVAAAQMGSRVLFIEADLRRPSIAQQFGVDTGPGLADVLIGAASLSDATQMVELDPRAGHASQGCQLAVLVAGAEPPPNPGGLLESHAMERVLENSIARYDLVILDTAPLAVVSDTFPLLNRVDGVILVGRVGYDRRDVAQRLCQTLEGGGSPLLGVIANGFKARRNAQDGYAYYGYTTRDSTRVPVQVGEVP
jgi:succinoglycan biosynthesis transport protein ExoP